jgi:hypothetical protein
METVARMGVDPDIFKSLVSNRASKRAIGSENLVLKVSESVAFPGDQVDFGWTAKTALKGKYLVQKVFTQIRSAIPSHEITLVRV